MLKTLGIAIALLVTGVNAQQIGDGTVDVYFQQLSRNGVRYGCSLVFTSLVSDTAYSNGKQIIMNGNIAVQTFKDGQLSLTGKLGTKPLADLDKTNTWATPAHFYFSSQSGTTAKAAKMLDAESNGYKLLLANAFDERVLALIMDIIKTQEFTVGFNRKHGGLDVYTVVNINTSLQRNPDGTSQWVQSTATPLAFNSCIGRLFEDIKQQLSK